MLERDDGDRRVQITVWCTKHTTRVYMV